ncbi:MAG: DUF6364 family protein [Bacteroidota bacterium]
MNTKLTLSVEKEVIRRAKQYAKEQGRSLSNIVEEYLKSVSTKYDMKDGDRLDPIVNELWGSVKLPNSDKAYKELLEDALIKKYLK